MMKLIIKIICATLLLWIGISLQAEATCANSCCERMGGIHYCDSSAGRYVCRNGDYSACYCTRHAVMDLQLLAGCCLWQGGVLKVTERGFVLCNNGGFSEMCSLQSPHEKAAVY